MVRLRPAQADPRPAIRTCAAWRTITSFHAHRYSEALEALSADEVDEWLADKAKGLSTDTLRGSTRSFVGRSYEPRRREKVHRNVVMLCEIPTGVGGRP